MALTDEEKAQLEALNRKSQEPDPAEDFEIEIFDGQKGARLPYSKGRSFLQQHFGLDIGDPPGDGDGSPEDKTKSKPAKSGSNSGNDPGDNAGNRPVVLRHLGQRNAG
jgi:hypothetical protein